MAFCIILRGLPGSGKTTLANIIANRTGAVICSANHFFEKDGEYRFIPEMLPAAHAACMADFMKALRSGQSVVVDNTHSRFFEYRTYIQVAAGAEYRIIIVQLEGDTNEERRLFFSRNIHGISDVSFGRMAARWENDARAMCISWREISPGGEIPPGLAIRL